MFRIGIRFMPVRDPAQNFNPDLDPGLSVTTFWGYKNQYEYLDIFSSFIVQGETALHAFIFEKARENTKIFVKIKDDGSGSAFRIRILIQESNATRIRIRNTGFLCLAWSRSFITVPAAAKFIYSATLII